MTGFIVAGTQRSGTTLIRTSLDSHPRITCIGEAFKMTSWRGRKYAGELGYPAWVDNSTKKLLGHYLWRKRNVYRYLDDFYDHDAVDAIGFKYMYNHTRRFPMVVDYAVRHQIHVIHVIRRNVFKKLVSKLTAHARGQHHSQVTLEVSRIHVPTSDLVQQLDRLRDEGAKWQAIFQGKTPYSQVIYEEFVAEREQKSREILDFLGLPYLPLTSSLVKLNPEDLSQIVINFEEVEACLRHTEFARYLS